MEASNPILVYLTHFSPVLHSMQKTVICFAFLFFFFFFYQRFVSRLFTNHRTAGEGGGYFFNSSLPLRPASQTLTHQSGDYCRELISAHRQQPDSNREALDSELKSTGFYMKRNTGLKWVNFRLLSTTLNPAVSLERRSRYFAKILAYTNTTKTRSSIFSFVGCLSAIKDLKKIHLLFRIALKRESCNLIGREKQ